MISIPDSIFIDIYLVKVTLFGIWLLQMTMDNSTETACTMYTVQSYQMYLNMKRAEVYYRFTVDCNFMITSAKVKEGCVDWKTVTYELKHIM